MKKLLALLRSHPLLLLYTAGLLLVIHSIASAGGSVFMPALAIYLISLVGTYLGFALAASRMPLSSNAGRAIQASSRRYQMVAAILVMLSLAFILAHFISLGGVPIIDGMRSNDYYDIMRVRQSIFFEAPAFFRYGANVILKSILPFFAIYYLVIGEIRKSAIVVLVGCLYGAALMNKMLILLPVVPLLMYLLLARRFVHAAFLVVAPVALLGFLVLVQNPHVRPEFWTPRELATASGKPMFQESPSGLGERKSRAPQLVNLNELQEGALSRRAGGKVFSMVDASLWDVGVSIIYSFQFVLDSTYPLVQFVDTIYLRVFVVPGEVIVAWFENIPAKVPYGYGCGYRWLASTLGCEYLNFPRLINDLKLPVLAAEGIQGTMTAASFMEDYANFGIIGMALGGFLMAVVLWVFSRIYRANWTFALALNAIPLMMLLELSLSTVMVTGGWLVTGMLFLYFRPTLYLPSNPVAN